MKKRPAETAASSERADLIRRTREKKVEKIYAARCRVEDDCKWMEEPCTYSFDSRHCRLIEFWSERNNTRNMVPIIYEDNVRLFMSFSSSDDRAVVPVVFGWRTPAAWVTVAEWSRLAGWLADWLTGWRVAHYAGRKVASFITVFVGLLMRATRTKEPREKKRNPKRRRKIPNAANNNNNNCIFLDLISHQQWPPSSSFSSSSS